MGYYVHVPGKGEPTLEHDVYEDALAEAKRLALKNKKDVRIYRTEAVVKIKYETVVEQPVIGVEQPSGKAFYVGDDVLFNNESGMHSTGTVRAVTEGGMLELNTCDGIKVVHVSDIITIIH